MTETVDPFAGAFTVDGMDGIAWRAIEYKQVYIDIVDDEPIDNTYAEPIEDQEWIIAVMVGDDRRHEIEVSEITMIDDDDYLL